MCELPALLIDGSTLTQSLAIIDYLDETRDGEVSPPPPPTPIFLLCRD
jgi:glutathione S-transferase